VSRAIHQIRMSGAPASRARPQAGGASEPAFGKAAELGLLLEGKEEPIRQALDRLSRRGRTVDQSFRRRLSQLDPGREEYLALAKMDPLAWYRPLEGAGRRGATGIEAYREAVEQAAAMLIHSGVPEDHAIAAIGLHLEASLDSLESSHDVRALVRLT